MSTGFEPLSTQRARKRAEFEARRATNEQRRIEEDIENRKKLVMKMHEELERLREII
jgi:hypothetical protein